MLFFYKAKNLENFLTLVNNDSRFISGYNFFSILNFKLKSSIIFQNFCRISKKALKFHWNSYKLYENFSIYNVFLLNFFNSLNLILVFNVGFRKKNKKFFKSKKQVSFLFKLFNFIHFIRIKILKAGEYSDKFNSDGSFILHLFLKSSKHKQKSQYPFKFLLINRNISRSEEKGVTNTSYFFLKTENSVIFCFQKIQLFKIVLYYKKMVSKILLEKNCSVKKIEKILKKFLTLIPGLNFSVLLGFSFRLKALKTYLLSLINSKNIEFQEFAIHFIKKLIDLNLYFFFEWYTLLKLTFLEIFILANKKTNKSYPIILKFFQKNLIPSDYLGNILKILMNFLNVNETLVRIKTQIYLCFLFFLIGSKNFSLVSKKMFRDILSYKFNRKFIFRIPLLFLLFSLSFLRLNLNVFIQRLGEFSAFFIGNNLWNRKSYFSKFFTLFFKKIENNRVILFFKKKKEKKCRVCYNISLLDFKLALKFKIFFQAKKTSFGFTPIKFLDEEISTNIRLNLNNNLTMGTFFLFKDIFLSVVDMSIGNVSILHLRTNFFKVFLLNFFKKKNHL